MIRKIISIVLLIPLIATVVAFSKSEDRTVSAIADTYTCSLYPNKNHSLDKDLVVSRENGDTKDVYIAFCVGTLPVNDYRILLRLLTVSAVFDKNGENETPGITLSGLADHEWKQSELTFNSVPKKGSDVASFCTESNNLLEVDITDYVKNNISSRGYISLMLSVSGNDDAEFRFSSIESKTSPPQLLIDCNYVAPEETVAPETETPETKDYSEIGAPESPVVKPDTIEPWDLSFLPEDIYLDEYTSVPINHYTTNLLPYENLNSLVDGNIGKDAYQLINAIAISPTNPYKILVGSNCHGIYRSEDGGKVFSKSSEGMNVNWITQIVFYPDDDNIVFSTTQGGGPPKYMSTRGVFKSTDSGKTWRRVCGEIGFANDRAWRLISFGDKNSSGIRPVYVAGNNSNRTGLWKSDDLGETWTQILSDKVCHQVDVRGDRVVVACAEDGLFISFDAGKTWVNRTNGIEKKNIVSATVDPMNTKHILAISNDEMFESYDEGVTWDLLCDRHYIKANILKQIIYGPKDENGHARLYLGTRKGQFPIRYSDDNGKTWNLFEAPARGYWDCMIAFSEMYPDYVYATIAGMMVSTDRGNTYKSTMGYGISGMRTHVYVFDEKEPSNIWCGGVDYGVLRTQPYGDERYPMITPQPMKRKGVQALTVEGLARDPSNPNRILYASNESAKKTRKLFESLDGGWNFKPLCPEILFDDVPILFSKQEPNIIYIGSLKSYDGGNTWEKLPKTVTAMSDLNHNIVYSNTPGKSDYVYISEDGGYTWAHYTDNKYNIKRFITIDADDPYRIYLPAQGKLIIKDESSEQVIGYSEGILKTASGYTLQLMAFAQNPQNHDHVAVAGRDASYGESSEHIFESYDRGVTWRAIPIPPPGDVFGLAFHPTRPEIYYGTSGGTYVYNYENYEKGRPASHYYDTEGTYCEAAVNYLWELGYLTEASNLEYGIDKYQFEGDFLDWILKNEKLEATRVDNYFNDIGTENRYCWTVQSGLENGLLLPSDGENGEIKLLFKKLTHGMCAKYLVRLMKIKGMNTDAALEDVSRYIKSNISPDVANAVAVLSKYGVICENDVFEFSPEKVATRGEIAVLLSRTLKLFK